MLHKKKRLLMLSLIVLTTGVTGIFGGPIATALARSIDVLLDPYTVQRSTPSNPQGETDTPSLEMSASNTFSYSNKTQTIQCGGSEAVSGDSNNLTYTGQCSELILRGSYNWVTLEAPARVVDLGKGNNIAMVIPTTGKTQDGQQQVYYLSGNIYIFESYLTKEINCYGANLLVFGNANTLSVQGTCSSLTIRGNGNQIKLENPTILFNSGSDNSLK